MKCRAVALSFVLTVTAPLACKPDVGAVVDSAVTGFVVAAPVGGADVTAYAVDDNGRRKEAVGSTKSEPDGTFSVDIGGQFGPTLVCASHGTYAEEASGGIVDVGPNELCALIDDQKLGQTTAESRGHAAHEPAGRASRLPTSTPTPRRPRLPRRSAPRLG